MRNLLHRYPFLEPLFRPFMDSSAENVQRTQNTASSNASTSYVPPRESDQISSRSVVTYRSPQPNLVDPSEDMFTSDLLLSLGIARSQLSRGNLVSGMANPYNFPMLPSSSGLLSHYSQGQHLAYLGYGILPQHGVISLTSSTMASSPTSSSSSSIEASPAASSSSEIVVAAPKALSKYKKSFLYREDALDSFSSQVFLPPSQVRPAFLTEEQYIEICVCAAFLDLLKKGAPLSDLTIVQNLLRGWPGRNLDNLQFITANLEQFKAKLDFRRHLTSDILESMSEKDIERLASVVFPKDASLFNEMFALGFLNSNQSTKLVHIGDSRTPLEESCLYNNSGNPRPDFKENLNAPVGQYTHMAYDFKLTRRTRGNYDAVIGVSDNMEMQLIKAQNVLDSTLSRISHGKNVPNTEKDIADAFIHDLEQNRLAYLEHQDIHKHILGYNSLRDRYCDFLIRNKVGMNLIVPISTDNVVVDTGLKQSFSTTFKHFYESENSSLATYLNKVGPSQNGAKLDMKKLILDYVLSNF